MADTITVIRWEINETFKAPDKDMQTYELGHELHGSQISIHGSVDLVRQVLGLLNAAPITYIEDDEIYDDEDNDDLVERAAIAMCDSNQYAGYWDKGFCDKNRWRRLARAAIESMREPTDKMVTVMMTHGGSSGWGGVWQNAIDFILDPLGKK